MYIICTYNELLNYQWDPKKAASNITKHGVDFADAVGVFEDERAMTVKEEIVDDEQRFATLGMDFPGQVIVVVYTYRADDIRMISARPATIKRKKSL